MPFGPFRRLPYALMGAALVVTVSLSLPKGAQAQCEGCPNVQKEVALCVTHSSMPDRCVQFVADDPFFYYSLGKDKPLAMELPPVPASIEALMALLDKDKKLERNDALLLQYALMKWDSAKAMVGFMPDPAGVYVKMAQTGKGQNPSAGNTVRLHYKAMRTNGDVVQSTYDKGKPIEVTLGEGKLIKGWEVGLPLFQEGAKGKLYVPYHMAYGDQCFQNIPPKSDLIFELEIISVK